MTKEELILQITSAMHKGHSKLESFNSYECIKGYFYQCLGEKRVALWNTPAFLLIVIST